MQSIIKIKKISDLNKKKIFNIIDKNGYAIISGLFGKNEIKNALKNFKKNFIFKLDKASTDGSPEEIKKNFQKLCVGSASNNTEKIYRLHRIIYNPPWDANKYKLKKIFEKFGKIRNFFLEFNENFCINNVEKNLWPANRILQYPSGGGHMSCHTDYILKNVSEKNNINKFYQLILLLTEKKKHYKTGGAYIVHNKKKILLEDFAKQGDLLIYKSTIEHGVEEIDSNLKLDLKKPSGRIILMNSLYQDFSQKKNKSKFYKIQK